MNLFLILSLLFQEAGMLGRMNMEHFTLQETATPEESTHTFWWLNSGGYYFEKKDHSHTIQGELPEGDEWQLAHARRNSRDTDSGRRPQNIFRLLSKGVFANHSQEVYFNIAQLHLSESELRAGDNGVLLFSGYQDGANFYYAGLRVDGHPVIKKKVGDIYHTLAYPAQVFTGLSYHRDENPSLLPLGTWIGLRKTVRAERDGAILIRLYVDKKADDNWDLVAEARDDGNTAGKPFSIGRIGIRTDFMDVRFRGYKVETRTALH
jgi:hypothetical protein